MNPKVLQAQGSLIRLVASRKRPTSIDLGLGEPTLMPNLAHFDAAMEYVRGSGIRYTPNAGDAELRERIARHYAYPGLDAAENVCVTVGSQEAMYATLLTLLDASADELLVIEPAFPSYLKMAALNGVAVRTVDVLKKLPSPRTRIQCRLKIFRNLSASRRVISRVPASRSLGCLYRFRACGLHAATRDQENCFVAVDLRPDTLLRSGKEPLQPRVRTFATLLPVNPSVT